MRQFSREDLKANDAAHVADVATLVAHRGYAQLRYATQYVENKLSALWRPILGIDDDDESLVDQLDFTPTMTLVLHLFGRAVHHHATERSRLPVIRSWRHVMDRDSSRPRFPRAVSKNDIARVIGKSRSSVDDAIDRFRGKSERYEVLFEKRVALPMYAETGIMFDVMLSANLSFAFMLDDYTYAGKLAEDARLNDALTNHKQRTWCHEAVSEKLPVSMPTAVPANTAFSAAEVTSERAS